MINIKDSLEINFSNLLKLLFNYKVLHLNELLTHLLLQQLIMQYKPENHKS